MAPQNHSWELGRCSSMATPLIRWGSRPMTRSSSILATGRISSSATMRRALPLVMPESRIHGNERQVEMHVVEGQTPMLLSGKWLYEQEAIVDFKRGQALFPKITTGDILQLERAQTHHLLLPIMAFLGNES